MSAMVSQSPASRLFTQPLVQAQIKENKGTKASDIIMNYGLAVTHSTIANLTNTHIIFHF